MSTVHEVIVARHMGVEVLGLSVVTNMAAGVLDQPIDHEEVMETGLRAEASSPRSSPLSSRRLDSLPSVGYQGTQNGDAVSPSPNKLTSSPQRPLIIGIAGCSGSGKTTLARELATQLSATLFPLDFYYIGLSPPPSRQPRQAELRSP